MNHPEEITTTRRLLLHPKNTIFHIRFYLRGLLSIQSFGCISTWKLLANLMQTECKFYHFRVLEVFFRNGKALKYYPFGLIIITLISLNMKMCCHSKKSITTGISHMEKEAIESRWRVVAKFKAVSMNFRYDFFENVQVLWNKSNYSKSSKKDFSTQEFIFLVMFWKNNKMTRINHD